MTASYIALRWGAATSTGWRSDGNEDSFVVDEMLFAVADGLGGYRGGEIASKLAVRILHRASRQKTLPMSGWLDDLLLPDHIRSFKPGTRSLYQTFREIDHAILEQATHNLHLTGMATTLCAMQVHQDENFDTPYFSIANVGDSRLYRFSSNQLQQITEDHTVAQELIHEGRMTAQQATQHESRHKLTQALGGFLNERGVDMWEMPVVAGDRFMLCSDGLVEGLDSRSIARLLGKHRNPQATAEMLVKESCKKDGRDDTTTAVVDVVPDRRKRQHG